MFGDRHQQEAAERAQQAAGLGGGGGEGDDLRVVDVNLDIGRPLRHALGDVEQPAPARREAEGGEALGVRRGRGFGRAMARLGEGAVAEFGREAVDAADQGKEAEIEQAQNRS